MQSAIGLDPRSDKVLHLLGFTHVRFHKDGFASLALDQVRGLDTCWIDITDYNLRAVLRKAKGGGTTNSGAAARDERNLAGEVECVFVRGHSSYFTGWGSGNFQVPSRISFRGR